MEINGKEYDVTILTESQRKAFILCKQGKTFSEIAKQLMMTIEGARRNYQRSVWAFKHYDREKEQHRIDMLPIDYPITRRQLVLVAQALDYMQQQTHYKGYINLHGKKLEYDDKEVSELIGLSSRILDQTRVILSDKEI